MRKLQKSVAVALFMYFILAAFFSFAFVVNYANHPCTGDSCEVCLQFEQVANTLRQPRTAILTLLFFLAVPVYLVQVCLCRPKTWKRSTLISLNVQMNN